MARAPIQNTTSTSWPESSGVERVVERVAAKSQDSGSYLCSFLVASVQVADRKLSTMLLVKSCPAGHRHERLRRGGTRRCGW